LVIVSHLHSGHFDPAAKSLVPKHLPLLRQPGDEDKIRAAGFADAGTLADRINWHGIKLIRRDACHGVGPVVEKTHLDVLNHATVGRDDLRRYARSRGISAERLCIPETVRCSRSTRSGDALSSCP
jgi:hypothetical protein